MSNEASSSSCSMTGLLGIIIQLALGVLSFSVLIIKRFRETPRRPWKIWLFDTSKQLISQLMAHFINLTISLALSYNDDSADQCLWYLTTNILDNTLGVLICVYSLRAIEWSLARRGRTKYISGNYYAKEKIVVQIEIMDLNKGEVKDSIEVGVQRSGYPLPRNQMNEEADPNQDHFPDLIRVEESKDLETANQNRRSTREQTQAIEKYQINYKAWLVQLLIWVSVVVMGKLLLFGFEYGLKEPLKQFSFILMGWIESYPIFELLVAIVVVPVVMNGLAFWVQDNFLMKRQKINHEGENPLIEEQCTQSPQKDQNNQL